MRLLENDVGTSCGRAQDGSGGIARETSNPLALGLRCMGTHVCRAFMPQCNAWPCPRGLLMEKSSQKAFRQSDMQPFRWRTPSPPNIQCWHRTTTQNARVCEQRKFRKAACCTYTPTLNIGARGLAYRCVCKAKWISRCRLFSFHLFANFFPPTVKKHVFPFTSLHHWWSDRSLSIPG